MSAPAVSVVITAYNQAHCLGAAVESVLAQDVEGLEVVIADDASTDATPDVVRDLEARHPGTVRAVLAPANRGVAANRNAGLAAARGTYITWLDGDDVFLPGKLARERAALAAHPEARWAYSQVIIVDAARHAERPRYADPPRGDAFVRVAGMMGAAPRNPLAAAEALRAVGPFDERMGLYEDFDLILRLARRFPCAYVAEPGMEYRIHAGGLHAATADRHGRNFALLRQNFMGLLDGLAEADRRRARRDFMHRGELLLLGGDLADGNRAGAARHLLRSLAANPATLLSGATLRMAMRVLATRSGAPRA